MGKINIFFFWDKQLYWLNFTTFTQHFWVECLLKFVARVRFVPNSMSANDMEGKKLDGSLAQSISYFSLSVLEALYRTIMWDLPYTCSLSQTLLRQMFWWRNISPPKRRPRPLLVINQYVSPYIRPFDTTHLPNSTMLPQKGNLQHNIVWHPRLRNFKKTTSCRPWLIPGMAVFKYKDTPVTFHLCCYSFW